MTHEVLLAYASPSRGDDCERARHQEREAAQLASAQPLAQHQRRHQVGVRLAHAELGENRRRARPFPPFWLTINKISPRIIAFQSDKPYICRVIEPNFTTLHDLFK